MTSLLEKKDKLLVVIDDCRKHGIEVLPPDINESNHEFTVVNGGIRFGLQAIKGIGEAPINAICAARKEGGKFISLFDFCERVSSRACGKSAIETLIKCGAFDSIHPNRQAMLDAAEGAIESGQKALADALSGQINMFGETTEAGRPKSMGQLPNVPDADRDVRLGWEKELLGLYISDHPLLPLRGFLEQETTSIESIASDRKLGDGARVTIGGMVTAVQRRVDKNGRTWATLTLEDLTGSMEILAFSKVFGKDGELVKDDAKLLITGRLTADNRRSMRDEEEGGDENTVFKIMADAIEEINVAEASEVPASEAVMSTVEIDRTSGNEFEAMPPEAMSGEAAATYAFAAQMPPADMPPANGGMTLNRNGGSAPISAPNTDYGPNGNGAVGALQQSYANGNGHANGYSEDGPARIARGFYPPPTASDCVHLHFTEEVANAAMISKVWNICRAHHGETPVWLHIDNGIETMQLKVSDSFNVEVSPEFCAQMREVLGHECVIEPCLSYG
jgi:hypothetical protein